MGSSQAKTPALPDVMMTALEATPYGVILLERRAPAEFLIRWLNPAARELEELDDRPMEGRPLRELGDYVLQSGVIEAAEEAYSSSGPVRHQTRLSEDGDLVHCHDDTLFRLPGTGMVALMYHDATARARAEDELRRLSAAIEYSIDGVALIDVSGNVHSANPAMERLLAVRGRDLIGRPLKEFFDTGEAERFLTPALEEVCLTGQHLGECSFRRKDGESVPARVSLSLFEGRDGAAGGVALIARNITKSRQREEQLRLLSTAVHEATDGVMITDGRIAPPGPRIRFVNDAFTRLLGYRLDEIMDRTPSMLQGEKTDRSVLAQLAAALRADRSWRGDIINYTKRGEPIHMEWHISPAHNEEGRITHFVAVISDVSEREKARAAKARSDQMAAIVRTAITYNHEINNPLQAIVGNAELLQRETLSNEARESLSEIFDAADRIRDVLRRIDEVAAPNFVPYVGERMMLDLSGQENDADPDLASEPPRPPEVQDGEFHSEFDLS